MIKEIIELLENISENRIFHDDSMDENTFLEDEVEQMLEKLKSSNSDYAKCKSICCPFYDEKMEFNCCANESLCEKCMNSQQFASNSDSAKCIRCNNNNRSRLCEKCIDEIRHFT